MLLKPHPFQSSHALHKEVWLKRQGTHNNAILKGRLTNAVQSRKGETESNRKSSAIGRQWRRDWYRLHQPCHGKSHHRNAFPLYLHVLFTLGMAGALFCSESPLTSLNCRDNIPIAQMGRLSPKGSSYWGCRFYYMPRSFPGAH